MRAPRGNCSSVFETRTSPFIRGQAPRPPPAAAPRTAGVPPADDGRTGDAENALDAARVRTRNLLPGLITSSTRHKGASRFAFFSRCARGRCACTPPHIVLPNRHPTLVPRPAPRRRPGLYPACPSSRGDPGPTPNMSSGTTPQCHTAVVVSWNWDWRSLHFHCLCGGAGAFSRGDGPRLFLQETQASVTGNGVAVGAREAGYDSRARLARMATTSPAPAPEGRRASSSPTASSPTHRARPGGAQLALSGIASESSSPKSSAATPRTP